MLADRVDRSNSAAHSAAKAFAFRRLQFAEGFEMGEPLFVFALKEETQGLFERYDHLYTGVGKVQAAYALTRMLAQKRPSVIVNLGTAGSIRTKPGSIVHCQRFVQRDMYASGLGFAPSVTPFSDMPSVLSYGLDIKGIPEAVCGTGDNFVMQQQELDYDIVDMEAYALAFVAMRENIPFACLKYISDGADQKAATDWPHALQTAALALSQASVTLFLTSGVTLPELNHMPRGLKTGIY